MQQAGLLFAWQPTTPASGTALDPAMVTCLNRKRLERSDGKLGEVVAAGPPAVVGLVGDGWSAVVRDFSDQFPLPPGETQGEATADIVDRARRVRLVDAETWSGFMVEHQDLGPLAEELGGPPANPPPPPTTTTMPNVAIPGEDAARAAVTAAVEGLVEQDAGGSFVNIETGDDTAFWVPFFEEAWASPMATGRASYEVEQVAFQSEDRALIAFPINLEEQPVRYPVEGDAVKIDGRWHISRATVVRLLNQAVQDDRPI